jgi:hypothetical protein
MPVIKAETMIDDTILAAVTGTYGPDTAHQLSAEACAHLARAVGIMPLANAPDSVPAKPLSAAHSALLAQAIMADNGGRGLIERWALHFDGGGVAATVWLRLALPCGCGCNDVVQVPMPVHVPSRGTVRADLRQAIADSNAARTGSPSVTATVTA